MVASTFNCDHNRKISLKWTSPIMHINSGHSIKIFREHSPICNRWHFRFNETYLFRSNWSTWRMVSWHDRDWLKSISNSNLRRTDIFFGLANGKVQTKNEMDCVVVSFRLNAKQCVIFYAKWRRKKFIQFNLWTSLCVDCTDMFDIWYLEIEINRLFLLNWFFVTSEHQFLVVFFCFDRIDVTILHACPALNWLRWFGVPLCWVFIVFTLEWEIGRNVQSHWRCD